MRLKRLELYGYKSFASRVSFDFGEGITAVVGPNGSGKSNIADAIRWVMGEQSYSTLRAKSTQDMIFAGTRNRARLGMAEVILTLDNADGQIPLDFAEVTVGRRAFRSGENEYLLNGNRVRYRDILSLLGGAGLARSNYTVIGQGLVDAALALRPEARRALFEEAAGIAPELRKRDQALTRIRETERNLERANDILAEIKPRADRLRRQADRAQEHVLLSQDLRELQRIWYGYHWQRLQQDVVKANQAREEQQEHVLALRDHGSDWQQEDTALALQEQGRRDALRTNSDEQQSVRSRAEETRRRMAVAEERLRLVAAQRKTGLSELERLQGRQVVVTREIESAQSELAEQQSTLDRCRAELEDARASLGGLDHERAGLLARQHKCRDELTRLRNRSSQSRARLDQSLSQIETSAKEMSDLNDQISRLGERDSELAERQASLSQQLSSVTAQLDNISAERSAAVREVEGMESQSAALERSLTQSRAELERLSTRHDMLTRLRQDLTGYAPGVRATLARKHEGVLGTVASLIHVPSRVERAIESALGARLQNIVTETWDAAETAIRDLKRDRSGWATFLPLDTLRVRRPISAPKGKGIIGIGSELVSYDRGVQPAVDYLLGRIVVVEDLTTARRLLSQRTGASLFVTLDGETAQPSGVLSGGSRRSRSNLLAQEREWRQLPQQIEKQQQQCREDEASLNASRSETSRARQQLHDIEAQGHSATADIERIRTALATATQDQREAKRDRQWLDTRLDRANKSCEGATHDAEQHRQSLAEAEERELMLSTTARQLEADLGKIENGELRQRVAELDTRTAVAERTVTSQRRLIDSHQRNLAQIREQSEAKEAQIQEQAVELVTLGEDTASLGQAIEHLAKRLTELVENAHPVQEALVRLARQREELERADRARQERLREAEISLNRMGMECDRLADRRATLAQEIESDLGPIDLPDSMSHQLHLTLGDDVVALPTVRSLPQGLGEEIRGLRMRLRRIGTINPEAPQEYESLLERQTFLHSQASDLRGAIAALHEVIQELETIIERDFASTVHDVDSSFSRHFRTLFGGGSARLVMTDPDQAHSTGIEIIAHPPGKRAQSLSLLSGGERALTAVALLFALLDANPVPFCFLDEVDAALDESNVYRFREMLQSQAERSQFVVITHNRRTIEIASTLYGISMSEAGVSQTMSMRVDEKSA